MSYLSLLQQARQQPDILGQIGANLGAFARANIESERERAKILQQQGQAAYKNKDYEAAARYLGELNNAMRVGYGISPVVSAPVGAPIYAPLRETPSAQQLPPAPINMPQMGLQPRAPRIPGGPDFERLSPPIGIQPPTPRTIPRQEIGRDFTGAQTLSDLRTGLMIERPKPIEVSGALYDPESGQWTVSPAAQTPQTRMDLQGARLEFQGDIARERMRSAAEIAQARIDAAAARAAASSSSGGGGREKFIWQRMPDGSMRRVPDTAGVVSAAPPKGVLGYDENGNPIGFFNMPPQSPPKGGVKGKPKPKPAAPLSVTADPAKRAAIDKEALREFIQTTPGATDGTANIMIQSNPELRKKFIEIKSRIIMEADTAKGVVPGQSKKPDAFEQLLKEAQGK